MRAVLDACVLYPATSRNLLLELVELGAFEGYWSQLTLAELRDSLDAFYQGDESGRGYVRRLVNRIDAVFPNRSCPGMALVPRASAFPDADDLHVVAAALEASASWVVTFNLRDSPERLMPDGIGAVHPDDFLLSILSSRPKGVRDAIVSICERSGRKGPKPTLLSLLEVLAKSGVPRFVDAFVPALRLP